MLSSHALDALKEFYAERDASADMFARLREESAAADTAAATDSGEADAAKPRVVKPLSMDVFSEDWNESQFWVSLFGFLYPVCLSVCLFVCLLDCLPVGLVCGERERRARQGKQAGDFTRLDIVGFFSPFFLLFFSARARTGADDRMR